MKKRKIGEVVKIRGEKLKANKGAGKRGEGQWVK